MELIREQYVHMEIQLLSFRYDYYLQQNSLHSLQLGQFNLIIYNPVDGQTFRTIMYGPNYYQLYASTSAGYMRTFSCDAGYQRQYFQTQNLITSVNKFQGGYFLGLNSDNYLYQCASYRCSFLTSIRSSSVLAYCPEGRFIVTGQNQSYNMDFFNEYGTFQGYLTYMTNYVRSIDCSYKYLVSVDESGYVAINSLQEFPLWAMIVIAVGSVAILALIIFLIMRKIKAKRLLKAHLAASNQYTNIDSVPPQPYFNNNINDSLNNLNSNPMNPTYPNPPPYSSPPNYNPIPNTQYGANQYVPPPISFQPQPVQGQNPYVASNQVHSANLVKPYQVNQHRY